MGRGTRLLLLGDDGKTQAVDRLREALDASSEPEKLGVARVAADDALGAIRAGDLTHTITSELVGERPVWELVREAEGRGYHVPLVVLEPLPTESRGEGECVQPLPAIYYDPLTGLPNRSLFTQWLSRAVNRARRQKDYRFAVLLLDLDRFKVINNSFGHKTGDRLLVSIARRLMTHLRFSDAVARLSGDEFTILLDDISDVSDVVRIARRVHQALQDPFILAGEEIFPSVSIGIALSASGYERPENMLQDAETAMYRAKATEADYEIFDPDMRRRARETLRMETDLRRALERGEFSLHYQPIVQLPRAEVTGFEALLRWTHPERGMISPGEFVPVAEESGLIIPIGEWVLGEACQQMARWQRDVPEARRLVVNVNLSRKQLLDNELVPRVDQILRQTGIEPGTLNLEITESMVMENGAGAIETLTRLRGLGVHVCIDDFGTGYSSLSCLHRLPIHTIKIDRSFISRMGLDLESSEIVRTIVSLARSLGKKVVAEGVETGDQLGRLEALGCDLAQGFLFSRPVPSEEARLLMQAPLGQPVPV